MSTMTPQQAVTYWSNYYKVPTYVTMSIAQAESGITNEPPKIDSNGVYSTGIFQLNQKGQGAGYNPSQLMDPSLNAQIGISNMVSAWQQAETKGLTGYDAVSYVASNSGHPGYSGTLPSSYDTLLRNSYQTVTGATSTNSSGSSGGGSTTDYTGGITGTPTGIGGYLRFGFWGILGIVLVGIGVWVLLNPFSDVSSALRLLAQNAAKRPLEGAASTINSKNTSMKMARKSRESARDEQRQSRLERQAGIDAAYGRRGQKPKPERKTRRDIIGNVDEEWGA